MVKSRLRQRRPQLAVTVKQKSGPTAGKWTESNLYTNLSATHEQPEAAEAFGESGVVAVATDVFWFEAAPGSSLPAIAEQHVLVVGSTRYEVVNAEDQAGMGQRLRVVTKRVK
ncbi:MAG: hypothetical protein BroJett011_03970 [Chloroflexota bacterium]|nr:MAG: hypothetical protein BroJett011_03970 [Chloroflexota bacterium]